MTQPSNIAQSTEELAKLADEMWWLSGDRTVSFDWYTKRATLAAVYASTELFMTIDKSTEFRDTMGRYTIMFDGTDFLHRRLANVQTFGWVTRDVMQYVNFGVRSLGNIARSRGVGV